MTNFKPASKAPEAVKIDPKAPGKHNKTHPEVMKFRLLRENVFAKLSIRKPGFRGLKRTNLKLADRIEKKLETKNIILSRRYQKNFQNGDLTWYQKSFKMRFWPTCILPAAPMVPQGAPKVPK